jgi:hypothetical protein
MLKIGKFWKFCSIYRQPGILANSCSSLKKIKIIFSIFYIVISVDPLVISQPVNQFQKKIFCIIPQQLFHQHANFEELGMLNDTVGERRTQGKQRVPNEKRTLPCSRAVVVRRAVKLHLSAEIL